MPLLVPHAQATQHAGSASVPPWMSMSTSSATQLCTMHAWLTCAWHPTTTTGACTDWAAVLRTERKAQQTTCSVHACLTFPWPTHPQEHAQFGQLSRELRARQDKAEDLQRALESVGHERDDLQRLLSTKELLIESQGVQISQLGAA
eukprot:scaffold119633_cov19-Tisochrysis_lutea.AAC.1